VQLQALEDRAMNLPIWKFLNKLVMKSSVSRIHLLLLSVPLIIIIIIIIIVVVVVVVVVVESWGIELILRLAGETFLSPEDSGLTER
jgi:hypothetical protein